MATTMAYAYAPVNRPIQEGEEMWMHPQWKQWFINTDGKLMDLEAQVASLTTDLGTVLALLASGYTGTITTAQLTGGGTQGSMTFTNGVLTAQTPAT